MLQRCHDPVADQIINEIGAGSARIPQVVDLNRHRTTGQNAQPGPLGVPFKVDKNINLIGVDASGRIDKRLFADVNKLIALI